jgi:DNA-binding MarR family transcriptional regulator
MNKVRSGDVDSGGRAMGAGSAAFLLAQVGAHAAMKFGERLKKLKLAPHHAGILRILAVTPAITQQSLAKMLGIVPSRLVALIDEMESWGLVERRSDRDDRRRYALHLTEKGRAMLEAIGRVAREHGQELLAALSEEERRQMAILLRRIADDQGLSHGVHPGYRALGAR